MFSIENGTTERVVIGEWHHADVNLTLCTGPGVVYPDPEGRIRYMHAFQMTQNYIALPETSYMFDPCAALGKDFLTL